MQKEKNICDILKFEGIMSGGFGIAPRIVMRDHRLSIEAKAIYAYFQSFAGNRESAFPARDTILNELSISKTRYYKYLNQLIEYDYIRVEREENDGWKGRNIYVIVSNPESENSEPPAKVKKAKKAVQKPKRADKQPYTSTEAENHLSQKTETKRKINDNDSSQRSLARQLQIDELISKYPEYKADIKTIYSVIKDLVQSEEVKISGTVKKREAILETVQQLTDKHILFVLKKTRKYKGKINNKKNWISACLMNSIYESAEDIDAVIDPAVDSKHNQEPSSKKKKDQQKEQEVLSLHPYLAKRDSQLKRLYAQRARAVINGSASQDQIKREIDSLKSEMQQYVDTRKLDLKV